MGVFFFSARSFSHTYASAGGSRARCSRDFHHLPFMPRLALARSLLCTLFLPFAPSVPNRLVSERSRCFSRSCFYKDEMRRFSPRSFDRCSTLFFCSLLGTTGFFLSRARPREIGTVFVEEEKKNYSRFTFFFFSFQCGTNNIGFSFFCLMGSEAPEDGVEITF